MEQELFDTLAELEMRAAKQPVMNPDAAKFLSILAISNKAKIMVEVGSGTGYSTLWLAYAVSVTGGKVITCEIDPGKAEETRANLAKANLANYVEILVGDARTILRQRSEPVDLLFIDGEYGQYETYFDVVYKRMNVGSTVVADKVIAHENDLSDYTTYVQNHPNLESVTVPLGEGLEITVKISE
jgi:predicted O-methyltransferase YrrM